jgi:hypothetical protein
MGVYPPDHPKVRDVRDAIWRRDAVSALQMLDDDKALLKAVVSYVNPPGNWLHFAAEEGLNELIEWLLGKGVDMNEISGMDHETPLILAAYNGHLETVRLFLDRGAKIDLSKSIRNPLIRAISHGRYDVVALLVERGIDTKVKYTSDTMHQMDAWTFAMEQDQPEIAALFDDEGRTYKPGDGRPPPDPWSEHVMASTHDYGIMTLKPILPAGNDVEILYAAGLRRNCLLVTKGVSNYWLRDAKGGYRHELYIMVDEEWNVDESLEDNEWAWPFRWLFGVAQQLIEQQRSPAHEEFIDCRQWCETPAGYAGVLVLPSGSQLPSLEDNEKGRIDPLWLFPVFADEAALAAAKGVREFLTRFRSAGMPMYCTQFRDNMAG